MSDEEILARMGGGYMLPSDVASSVLSLSALVAECVRVTGVVPEAELDGDTGDMRIMARVPVPVVDGHPHCPRHWRTPMDRVDGDRWRCPECAPGEQFAWKPVDL